MVALALAALIVDAVYVSAVVITGDRVVSAIVLSLAIASYVIAGLFTWLRHPGYTTGLLLMLAGYVAFILPLARIPLAPLIAIGLSFQGLPEAVLGYLLLSFPSGKPAGVNRIGALVVVVGTVAIDALLLLTTRLDLLSAQARVPLVTLANPFLIVDLGTVVIDLQSAFVALGGALVFILLARRWIVASPAARRALLPAIAAGIIAASGVVIRVVPWPNPDLSFWMDRLGIATTALIPLALAVGFIRSRFAQAGVAELVVHGGRRPTPASLEASVRRTLHDPSARLLRYTGATDDVVDTNGQPASIAHVAGRQLTQVAAGDGQRLAAIEHDSVLAEEADLLSSVAAAVRIVLENERLATARPEPATLGLPTGIVTLVYADIEGSTQLLDRLRERYVELLRDLRQLLRAATREVGGYEVDSRADEFLAAVSSAAAAVHGAVAIQREIGTRHWPDEVALRIRMGLHTGEPDLTSEGYVGMDVNVAARIGSAAHGGQIVVSDATRQAAEATATDVSFADLGTYVLKGVPGRFELYQLNGPSLAARFPPLRAEPAPAV